MLGPSILKTKPRKGLVKSIYYFSLQCVKNEHSIHFEKMIFPPGGSLLLGYRMRNCFPLNMTKDLRYYSSIQTKRDETGNKTSSNQRTKESLNIERSVTTLRKLCEKKEMDKAEGFLQSMISRGFMPNVIILNILIHGYCLKNDMKKALQIVKQLHSNIHEPKLTPVHLTTIMNGYCENGLIEHAEKFLESINENYNMEPTPSMYMCILRGYLKKKRFHKALSYLNFCKQNNKIQDDVIIFSIVLKHLCQSNKLDMAKAYITQWESEHPNEKLDEIAIVEILNYYCKSNQMEKAMEILNSAETPNAHLYSIMLKKLTSEGAFDQTIEILKKMFEKNIQPNIVICNTLISSLSKHGKTNICLSILSYMKRSKVHPDIYSFHPIIDQLCHEGKLNTALSLTRTMENIYNVKAEIRIFNSLIICCQRLKRKDIALELYNEMTSRKLSPNSFTFSHLINLLCSDPADSSLILKSVSLFNQMCEFYKLEPEAQTINPIIYAMFNNGMEKEGQEFIEQLLKHKVTLNSKLIMFLSEYYQANNQEKQLKKIMELRKNQQAKTTPSFEE